MILTGGIATWVLGVTEWSWYTVGSCDQAANYSQDRNVRSESARQSAGKPPLSKSNVPRARVLHCSDSQDETPLGQNGPRDIPLRLGLRAGATVCQGATLGQRGTTPSTECEPRRFLPPIWECRASWPHMFLRKCFRWSSPTGNFLVSCCRPPFAPHTGRHQPAPRTTPQFRNLVIC